MLWSAEMTACNQAFHRQSLCITVLFEAPGNLMPYCCNKVKKPSLIDIGHMHAYVACNKVCQAQCYELTCKAIVHAGCQDLGGVPGMPFQPPDATACAHLQQISTCKCAECSRVRDDKMQGVSMLCSNMVCLQFSFCQQELTHLSAGITADPSKT